MGVNALGDENSLEDFVTIRQPGYVLAEMRTVDTLVGTLARDVQAANIDPSFKADFALFATEWRAFYSDHTGGPGAWISRADNAVLRKAQEYRNTALDWRDEFVRHGGVASTPAPARVKGGTVWPWVLIGAGIAVGVWWHFGRESASVRSVTFRRK